MILREWSNFLLLSNQRWQIRDRHIDHIPSSTPIADITNQVLHTLPLNQEAASGITNTAHQEASALQSNLIYREKYNCHASLIGDECISMLISLFKYFRWYFNFLLLLQQIATNLVTYNKQHRFIIL